VAGDKCKILKKEVRNACTRCPSKVLGNGDIVTPTQKEDVILTKGCPKKKKSNIGWGICVDGRLVKEFKGGLKEKY